MPEKKKHKPRIYIEKRDEIRNYLNEEINRNEIICKKHEKVCKVSNYIVPYLL